MHVGSGKFFMIGVKVEGRRMCPVSKAGVLIACK